MISQLLNSQNVRIQWAAQQAQTLESQFKSGDLSAEEYKELLEDLKRDETINKLSTDLQDKILLEQALNALIAVAGAV
jgi:polyhydroxyalkanoate synthesis regulator phasin